MTDITSYLRIIKKWWWVIVLLCGTTVGTLLALAYFSDIEYQATVTLQVSAPPPQEVPLYSQFGRMGLREEIDQNRSSFNELLLEGNVVNLALEKLPDVKIKGDDLLEEGKLLVELPDSSQLMKIQVLASNPETAAQLANMIAEVGLQEYGRLLAQSTVNARQFIERELAAAQADLDEAEAALSQFQIDNKVGSLDKAIDGQYELIRSLKIQRDLSRAEGDPAKADALDLLILEHEANLQNLIGLSGEYNQLQAHVERGRSTVNFLLDKSVEAQTKENQILEGGFIQIITPARLPRNPVSIINSSLITLAAVGSALAGILLAFLLEYSTLSRTQPQQQRRSERSEPIIALSDTAN
jgi:uncharacterized protein involved in exopolysaccharide biosynthesis